MDSLGALINLSKRSSPLVKGVQSALVLETVNDFIIKEWGEAGTKYARAMYIKNQILNIACLSSVMAQELKIKEKKLLQKIADTFGTEAVKKVRYLS